jgi:hypothetical protein
LQQNESAGGGTYNRRYGRDPQSNRNTELDGERHEATPRVPTEVEQPA